MAILRDERGHRVTVQEDDVKCEGDHAPRLVVDLETARIVWKRA